LTGLGTPTFTRALQAVKEIHERFDRLFDEGALEPWNEYQAGGPDTESIGLWNRYLTPAREAGGTPAVPFAPGVDPAGILQGMAQGDGTCSYVHTEDNDVRYYTTTRSGRGALQYAKHEKRGYHGTNVSTGTNLAALRRFELVT
jgi:hypothetical protein